MIDILERGPQREVPPCGTGDEYGRITVCSLLGSPLEEQACVQHRFRSKEAVRDGERPSVAKYGCE